MLDIIEQYDFFYKNLLFTELVFDQQKEKNQNLRTVIQINFDIKSLQTCTDYNDYENQLQQTFVEVPNDEIVKQILEVEMTPYK